MKQKNFIFIFIFVFIFILGIQNVFFNEKIKNINEEKVSLIQQQEDLKKYLIKSNKNAKMTFENIKKVENELLDFSKEIKKIEEMKRTDYLKNHSFTFPQTKIYIDKKGTFHRTEIQNSSGGNHYWVMWKDGVNLYPSGSNNDFSISFKEEGTYMVYFEQFVNGEYRVISNVVGFEIGDKQ